MLTLAPLPAALPSAPPAEGEGSSKGSAKGATGEEAATAAAPGEGSGKGSGEGGEAAFDVLGRVDQGAVFGKVLAALAKGRCLGIFPEGGSSDRSWFTPGELLGERPGGWGLLGPLLVHAGGALG